MVNLRLVPFVSWHLIEIIWYKVLLLTCSNIFGQKGGLYNRCAVYLSRYSHCPNHKFQKPKYKVTPNKSNVGIRLMQTPDMQSMPLSFGTHNSPGRDLDRQHPGPRPMIDEGAQYWVVVLQPELSSEHKGVQKRSSTTLEKPLYTATMWRISIG